MEISLLKKRQSDKLIFFGVLLLFLGLLVGVFIPVIANPRMALSSHLEGITNGFFLIILGLIWNKLELSGRWLGIIYWLSLYGTYATLIAVLLAAIFKAGMLMPIAGGQEGTPVIEGIVSFLVVSLAIGMLFFCVILMIGLYKHMYSHHDTES
jgi:hydroxylaminobenzene mutase